MDTPNIKPVESPETKAERLNAAWFAAARETVAWGISQGLLRIPRPEIAALAQERGVSYPREPVGTLD